MLKLSASCFLFFFVFCFFFFFLFSFFFLSLGYLFLVFWLSFIFPQEAILRQQSVTTEMTSREKERKEENSAQWMASAKKFEVGRTAVLKEEKNLCSALSKEILARIARERALQRLSSMSNKLALLESKDRMMAAEKAAEKAAAQEVFNLEDEEDEEEEEEKEKKEKKEEAGVGGEDEQAMNFSFKNLEEKSSMAAASSSSSSMKF